MGYNLSEAAVHTYRQELDTIMKAAQAGETAIFDCPKEHLAQERYRLREAMKSAEAFPSLYGGKYSQLGQLVTVKVMVDLSQLHVIPKSSLTNRLTPPDERRAISSLEHVQANMHVLEFYPSPRFDEQYFCEVVEKRGWRIYPDAKQVDPSGKVSYPIDRIPESHRGLVEGKKGRAFSSLFGDPDPDPDDENEGG